MIKLPERVNRINEWQGVCQAAQDPIIMVDPNYVVKAANRAVEVFLQKSAKEIIGKKCYKLFHGTSSPIKDCPFRKTKKTKKRAETEIYQKKEKRWLLVTTDPIVNSEGVFLGARHVIRDITAWKRSEELLKVSEQKYRLLFETANDAIFVADITSGRILDANKQAAKLLGRPVREIIGMHQTQLHPPEEAAKYRRIFQRYIEGKKGIKIKCEAINKNGKRVPIQIWARVIDVMGEKLIMGIFTDLTAIKRNEDILRGDKERLEKLVVERTAQLMKSNKELMDSQHLKEIGTLAAIVAHELKNPLGVIKTAVYNIRRKKETSVLDGHLVSIDKKVAESDQIINNLLSYSKIKLPQFSDMVFLRTFKEIANNCKNNYVSQRIEIKIEHNCPDDSAISADPVQVAQLFSNILNNACEAISHRNGRVEITLDYNTDKNALDIIVKDNGDGVDERNLVKLYNPFFTTRAKGTGLGLAVCKEIIKLHNGSIDIQSEKGKGTTVYLTLPIRRF